MYFITSRRESWWCLTQLEIIPRGNRYLFTNSRRIKPNNYLFPFSIYLDIKRHVIKKNCVCLVALWKKSRKLWHRQSVNINKTLNGLTEAIHMQLNPNTFHIELATPEIAAVSVFLFLVEKLYAQATLIWNASALLYLVHEWFNKTKRH